MELGGAIPCQDNLIQHMFDPEILKYVAMEICEQAGVELLLHTLVTDAIVEGRTLKGGKREPLSSGKARVYWGFRELIEKAKNIGPFLRNVSLTNRSVNPAPRLSKLDLFAFFLALCLITIP